MNYANFENLLMLKLETSHPGVAVLDPNGVIHYENFNKFNHGKQSLEIAEETVLRLKHTVERLKSDFPEYLILQGQNAFLILMPSLKHPHYYAVFNNNGLNVGMALLCVQNAVKAFELEN
jgi:hypothetical protein